MVPIHIIRLCLNFLAIISQRSGIHRSSGDGRNKPELVQCGADHSTVQMGNAKEWLPSSNKNELGWRLSEFIGDDFIMQWDPPWPWKWSAKTRDRAVFTSIGSEPSRSKMGNPPECFTIFQHW